MLQSSHQSTRPRGLASLRLFIGEKEGSPSVLWDTVVESADQDLPRLPDGFLGWLEEAHAITHDWFFKMIEGDLERQFDGS
jgi:uncharacterized protein (TIGR04255 family)